MCITAITISKTLPDRIQQSLKRNAIQMSDLDISGQQPKDLTGSSNCNSSRCSSSSIKQSIFASVDQVPAFTMVATEQEHEKRSRKLRAKLTESIARHQGMRSSSFTPDTTVTPNSSPTSEVKKKMFLSMAKEAKQRQQCSRLPKSSDTPENVTELELTAINRPEPPAPEDSPRSRRETSSSVHSSSSGSQFLLRSVVGDLNSKMDSKLERSCSPRIVARLRSRASSESSGNNADGKGHDPTEERRFSGSLLSKNVFTSLLSPLVQRSSREGQPSRGESPAPAGRNAPSSTVDKWTNRLID